MIRKGPGICVVVLVAFIAATLPVVGSVSNSREVVTIGGHHRWVRSPIIVSFSTSLTSPPSNIKAGADVADALRRALKSWGAVAEIKFFETASTAETISPPSDGDGINLITVSAANGSLFESSDAPARTRVFYDSGGTIIEADIALNPAAKFSADGTPGTYDLESTFAHEIGHLLGLEHSAVIGATMQPRQAKNGLYNLPAFSARTLSEDDVSRARALYGPEGASSITGRLTTNLAGRARSIFGAHFFAEDAATGRVVASSITFSSGQYRIDGLRAGVYRVFAQPLEGPIAPVDLSANNSGVGGETDPPFRSFVASHSTPSQSLNFSGRSTVRLGFFVFSATPKLRPGLVGMNGELSTAPLPLRAGETFTVYVAGEGVENVSLDAISISSALIRVVPESLKSPSFDVPYPVISFEVTVDKRILPGDYTIRLQSHGGELAYLPGAITIDAQ